MTAQKASDILSDFNKWRRGDDEDIEQPLPKEIGEAIDTACVLIQQLIENQTNQTNGKTD